MIGYLNGKLIDKRDSAVIIDVNGVGYEVLCASRTVMSLPETGEAACLHIQTQYRADGASLFGFISIAEKNLFLELIKVDSVGPKSALNILSAAPWLEIVQLIEDGDVGSLAKLPKISKKTAEHLVVKLKGKLQDLLSETDARSGVEGPPKVSTARKQRSEVQTVLTHLGYRQNEIERALDEIDDAVWSAGDLQSVIRAALNDLSGNVS